MQIQFVMMAIFYDSVIRLIDNIPLIVVLELSPFVSPFVYIFNINLAYGYDRSVFLVNS